MTPRKLDKPINSSPFRLTVASARTNLLLTAEATVRWLGRPTSADPKPRLKEPESTHSFRGRAKTKTKKDVARLVRQLLDEQLLTGHWDRKDLPRIRRFFEEFFGFHRAGTVFKDNDRRGAEKINQWNTTMLIHDARMLIEHVLKKDTDVIAELLTTNKYFIAHPGDNEYAREHYEKKVAEIMDPGFVQARIELRKEQIKRDFNFEDMPEKAKNALESARRDAEKTVAMYQAALDKGMHRHPNFPVLRETLGVIV